jgi:hypothetical protein
MKRYHLLIVTSVAALGSVAAAKPVAAQKYLFGVGAGASSGIEGGGPQGTMAMTRTRVRIAVDARIDESPQDVALVGLDAEVTPTSGIGADLRYGRILGDRLVLSAGVLGILVPWSLYGTCGILEYRIHVANGAQITLAPEADVFFLGTDLPDGTAIWQFRLNGGIRVDL